MIINKILKKLMVLIPLTIIQINTFAQSPGGVSSSLRLWLKADAGTSTTSDNTTMTQWNDQSGNSRNATQSTVSRQPAFKNNYTDNMNFNSVVDFTASNYNNFSLPTSVLPSGTGSFSMYFVSRKNSNNGMTMLGLGTSVNNESINVGTNGNALGRFHTWNNAWAPSVSTLVNGAVIQSSYNFQSAVRYMSINSVSYGSSSASINLVPNGAYLGANHSSPTASNFEGEISEVIVYSTNSTTSDKLKIESYLSMKYGITKSGNYVNSAGTVIWNSSTNSTYHNNIAIIGRDDGSGLIQKQSRSSISGFQPVIGNSSVISDLNSSNSSSFSVDQSFLVSGSSTGTTTFSTAYAEGYRMNRIWKVQETGTIGTVKVGVLASDVTGVIYLNLLISNDAVFDATDTRYQMSTETIGGLTYFTKTVDFTDGQYFNFMSSSTPLPVELINFQINCDNALGTVVSWETNNEKNSSYFILEKSPDGNKWNVFSNIPSTGIANQLKQYSVLDSNSYSVNYYRITQVDANENKETFPIAISNCKTSFNSFSEIQAYPNPSSEDFVVNFNSSEALENARILLINNRGKTFYDQSILVNKGSNTFIIKGTIFPPGIYLIEVFNESEIIVSTKHIVR